MNVIIRNCINKKGYKILYFSLRFAVILFLIPIKKRNNPYLSLYEHLIER